MQKYVDYEFYKNEYFGELTEKDFNKRTVGATQYLDYMTQGKIKTLDIVPLEVKHCLCELIDTEYRQSKALLSESVGKHSKTYAKASVNSEVAKQIVITKYLSSLGLLYRGVAFLC